MIVGVTRWDLHLAGCQSLKDKRRIVKSLKDRLHQRFGVLQVKADIREPIIERRSEHFQETIRTGRAFQGRIAQRLFDSLRRGDPGIGDELHGTPQLGY